MGDLNTRDPDMGAARTSDRDREPTRDRERGAFNFAGEAAAGREHYGAGPPARR